MADLNKIVDDLSSLTVLEAAELSKLLEEKWGVSAAAPAAVAVAAAAVRAWRAERRAERRAAAAHRNRPCASDGTKGDYLRRTSLGARRLGPSTNN